MHNATTFYRLTILSDQHKEISMTVRRSLGMFCAVVVLGLTPTHAQEKITLTAAESNPEYRIAILTLVPNDPATTPDDGAIILDLKGLNSEVVACRYNANSTPTATFLINALNKADLSTPYNNNATTGSLKQRVCHRLVVMGESTAVCGKTITGTCTGSVP